MISQQVLILSLLLVGVWGACKSPQKDFDVKRYMGQWTIQSFMSNNKSKSPMKCIKMAFETKGENLFHAKMTGIILADGSSYIENGPMILKNPDNPGVINIFWQGKDYFMTIIETDYDTYAAVNGCAVDGGDHVATYSAIFSRGSSLPEDTKKRLRKVLADVGIDISQLFDIDQSNCP